MTRILRAAMAAAVLSCLAATSAFAFGAIAVDDEKGMSAEEAGWGLGWGSSRSEAERDALRECRSAGNSDCKVAVWFEQCGAYVGNRVNYGIGYGSTLKEAERMAFKDCPNCKLVVSECE